jgi:crotonobetainyl-CoA:carnitine CoA-transferase CaiB-like acyl-CoA transferase
VSAALVPDPGPLSGLLVLDLGQAAVGPVAACYLGLLGATVVKVEPPAGDMVRRGQPTMRGTSVTFIGNNLGKRSVVLDLKTPQGLADAKRLVRKADVLIENFRGPDILEKLGLGYDAVLRPLNPGLVYLQSSAFGPSGPWSGMYSDEWMTECVSGCASVTGQPGGRGEITRGAAPLDWNGAMLNTVACLAALWARTRTGRGTMIRASQYGASVFAAITRIVEEVSGGVPNGTLGSASAYVAPDQAFATADGWVHVTVPHDGFWPKLCAAIGRTDLAADPRFATGAQRVARREALVEALAPGFAAITTAAALARLRAADVPCAAAAPRATLTGPLLADPQVAANAMLVRVESAFGPILTQSPHWSFDATPAAIRRPSPRLGEHTDEVLAGIDAWPSPGVAAPDGSRAGAGAAGALAGVRVVELAHGVPGPLAGQVLAQLGADVLRIEPPSRDWLRSQPPFVDGAGAVYRALNAGKRMRVLDLKSAEGRAALHEALADADLLLVGHRERCHARLGIRCEDLQRAFPRLVWCHVGGWGRAGPLADAPATELTVQAHAGLHRFLGKDGAPPVRLGFDVASVSAAMSAVQASLAALFARAAGGQGQRVDVSMFASTIAIDQWPTVAESGPDAPAGRPLQGPHWPPDHGFAHRDGRCLLGFREQPADRWRRFVVALGRVDLLADPDFLRDALLHAALVAPKLETTLAAWSLAALDRLVRKELGGTVVPILDLRQVLAHEQVAHTGVLDAADRLRLRLPLLDGSGLLAARAHG